MGCTVSNTITKPFFAYRKDWSRVGVATLEKIGQDWKKDWKKDWQKIGCFFLFPQTTRVMPEQMAAQEFFLKWIQTSFAKEWLSLRIRTNVGLPYARTLPEGIS